MKEIELGQTIEIAIIKAIETSHPKMQYDEINKCKLYIPEIAKNYLIKYINSLGGIKFDVSKPIKYRGHDIIVGYERAIIFVHDDYSMWGKKELINRIML